MARIFVIYKHHVMTTYGGVEVSSTHS